LSYSADNIDVLEGLEPVKQRPGMYTNTQNPNHIVEEVLDNSCDEAIGGYANEINIKVFNNKKVIISDNGRGIPVDMHKKKKKPAVEVIFTILHSGGKFNKGDKGNAYGQSGGLHGVGVSVTNALSEELIVNVKRDNKLHSISFSNGKRTKKLETIKELENNETGTEISILPNMSYFDEKEIDIKQLKELVESKAVLLNNVKFNLYLYKNDELTDSYEWCYQNGIEEYLKRKLKNENGLYFSDERFVKDEEFDSYHEGEGAVWSVIWDDYDVVRKSYVNLIPTKNGGTHETGFKNGLFEAIKNFSEQNGLIPRGVKLSSDDVWASVSFILSVKLSDPQFQGQTKEKLNNRSAYTLISIMVKDKFETWLNQNSDEAKNIVNKAIEAAQKRNKKKKRDINLDRSGITKLPGKLTDCKSKNPEECELFIVEGDSAGGSAKQARNREFQAIIPIKGKIKNTWEVSPEDLLDSEEVSNISTAIGVLPHSYYDEDVDLSKLRYHKICILADADVDGFHIQVLLLCLFLKHFPKLVEEGYVYICKPPLFRISVKARGKKQKAEKYYALDMEERERTEKMLLKKKIKPEDITVGRFKGLGEMEPDQLKETTLNVDTRRLEKVDISVDYTESKEIMDMLLSKKRSSDRKVWIESEGDFNKEGEIL
tara:strand:- start:125902 stop:127869 length:1968 start_codon:yes stop_codon:yes gene_type:complete